MDRMLKYYKETKFCSCCYAMFTFLLGVYVENWHCIYGETGFKCGCMVVSS